MFTPLLGLDPPVFTPGDDSICLLLALLLRVLFLRLVTTPGCTSAGACICCWIGGACTGGLGGGGGGVAAGSGGGGGIGSGAFGVLGLPPHIINSPIV